MIKKMNKKGAEKLFSIWWFVILAIVGAGIIIGVFIYFSVSIDVRDAESVVLGGKIFDCLIDENEISEEFFEKNFDLTEKCGLSSELKNSNLFYINVSVYNSDRKSEKSIFLGNNVFERECRVEKLIKAKHYPVCFQEQKIVFRKGEKISLVVLTGSNQRVEKISVIK